MALRAGDRLGPYEILAPLGEGGMGVVLRARDTRLNRDVALKVLPDSFAADPDRLARFQREAQVLAALNHPNIAAIYGIEESGSIRALVMELVEGVNLGDAIRTGRFAGAAGLTEARAVAGQVAAALEAAHDAGVVHRDLKPANIKLRPDGTVKVLDFGLAKALQSGFTQGVGMKRDKRQRLERAGWTVGDAAEFLGLSAEESRFIELKLALASGVRRLRERRGMTQAGLARRLGSSQSRVAKMEAGDASVSLDLMVRSLLGIGAKPTDIARLIRGARSHRAA